MSKASDAADAKAEAATERREARAAAAAPKSAADQLKALEAELFGEDAVRIDGKVERGVGSLYAQLAPADRARIDALEGLVLAEATLAKAQAAVAEAQDKLDVATKAAATADEAATAAAAAKTEADAKAAAKQK